MKVKEISFTSPFTKETYELEVHLLKYQNNKRPAIELIDKEDGSSFIIATINIPEHPIRNNEVIIKNYSENEGILEALIDAKIISKPIEYVQTGYVNVPVCKLLVI